MARPLKTEKAKLEKLITQVWCAASMKMHIFDAKQRAKRKAVINAISETIRFLKEHDVFVSIVSGKTNCNFNSMLFSKLYLTENPPSKTNVAVEMNCDLNLVSIYSNRYIEFFKMKLSEEYGALEGAISRFTSEIAL